MAARASIVFLLLTLSRVARLFAWHRGPCVRMFSHERRPARFPLVPRKPAGASGGRRLTASPPSLRKDVRCLSSVVQCAYLRVGHDGGGSQRARALHTLHHSVVLGRFAGCRSWGEGLQAPPVAACPWGVLPGSYRQPRLPRPCVLVPALPCVRAQPLEDKHRSMSPTPAAGTQTRRGSP